MIYLISYVLIGLLGYVAGYQYETKFCLNRRNYAISIGIVTAIFWLPILIMALILSTAIIFDFLIKFIAKRIKE